jgi:hypothetical protein
MQVPRSAYSWFRVIAKADVVLCAQITVEDDEAYSKQRFNAWNYTGSEGPAAHRVRSAARDNHPAGTGRLFRASELVSRACGVST